MLGETTLTVIIHLMNCMSLGKLTMLHYLMSGQSLIYQNTMFTNQLGITMENIALVVVGLSLLQYCQQVKYQITMN